jgi:predicted dehydrogenase
MNARQGQQMVDAARKARRILQIGLNHRFQPEVQFAKKLIDDGRIGKPYYARSLSIRRRGVPSWGVFGQKALQGGGPLIDIGVHSIDFTWYLMGCPRPVAVSGQTYRTIGDRPGHMGQFGPWDWKTYTVEDFAVALVRFANGATMMAESAFCVNLPETVFGCHVVGDKGGVGTNPLSVQLEINGHLTDCTPTDLPRNVTTHHVSVCEFVKAIVKGRPSLVPGSEVLWVQKMIDAIYASSKAGREVRIK